MNIFNNINDILYTKNGKSIENIEDENDFQPFLVNRWLSMHSPEVAYVVNETSNRYYSTMDDKQMCFRFLKSTVPKAKWKKFNYIKRIKKDKENLQEVVDLLASNLELSRREIINYIDDCSTTTP